MTDDTSHPFQIQSIVELDFVVGQNFGFPVGMSRQSPPEFRRRVLAAAISYPLQLRSLDYTLKNYVEPNLFEEEKVRVGDEISDFIKKATNVIMSELKKLHTNENITFGIFGSEITMYKIPHTIDVARMLSNRGLLLEVIPILRTCLEMMSWASVAFYMKEENNVVSLKAQNCISNFKKIYKTSGSIYGYLSIFSHWGYVVHNNFLNFDDEGVSILKASVRYRALTLALCLVIVDVFLALIRHIYGGRSEKIILEVQGRIEHDKERNIYKNMEKIMKSSNEIELEKIKSLLK